MNEETMLTWNATNWITVVLMVAVAWFLFVGGFALVNRTFGSGQ